MGDVYVSLPEEIAKKLGSMIIIDKKYGPNEKLPSEDELAREFGVSRTTIREAVKILISNDMLYIRRGVGTFVCDNEVVEKNPFKLLYSTSKKQLVLESLEVRTIIEVRSAQLAAERGTDEEIRRICEAERRCSEKIELGENFSDADKSFHLSIAEAAHNSILTQITPLVNVSIETILYAFTPQHKAMERLKSQAFRDHKKIAEFISDRNPEGAALAMYCHLQESLKWVRE